MAELLVSVRSVAEAEAALIGGAGLIDVKEPARGPLGRASAETIQAIHSWVDDRRPVSAALGELMERPVPLVEARLAFAKWGLSRCLDQIDWPTQLLSAARRQPGALPVAVSYADWHRAQAPPPEDVCAFACANGWGVFLMDTWEKDGRTLLDWLSLAAIERLCRKCRRAGVRIALAGSLGANEIRRLQGMAPDWFAVRGAVCQEGSRGRTVDAGRVRQLAAVIGTAAGSSKA